jgi:hypothetical protein
MYAMLREKPRFMGSSGIFLVTPAEERFARSFVPNFKGLMRWMPHAIVSPWWHASASKEYRDLLVSLNVPDWLYPDFGTSDRNVYDRCIFQGHDRTGEVMFITGLGVYPNLGVIDAYATLRQGRKQVAVRASDALADDDGLAQTVGSVRSRWKPSPGQ